ncbi:MAG: RNA methyltransferase [Candidatus Bathyarchaeia archaeon]|nr:RNA-binding protein [Candidatus Bathyarchaeota archaeon]
MSRKKISIAIPASVISDTPHLREKTSKIGLIGRAAAIFGVGEIVIYRDEPNRDQRFEANLIATLLNYMETPQYLRKRLFKLKPELKYAGILPPLRTPHHPLGRKITDLKVGEYREGVTIATSKVGTLVDVGVEKPAIIPETRLQPGKRVTVRITYVNNKMLTAILADPKEVPVYWGYKVTVLDGYLADLLKNRSYDLKIATSRRGRIFNEVMETMALKWKHSKTPLILFGAPTRGLYEIAEQEGFKLDENVDFTVNMIPGQCTETVRTEEAILASLAIFNIFFGFSLS